MVVDYGKIVVALASIGAFTYLAASEAVSGDLATGGIGVVIGYVLGNGKAAVARHTSTPVLGPKPPDRQDVIITSDGPRQLVPVEPPDVEPRHLAGDVEPVEPPTTHGFRVPGRHVEGRPDPFWDKRR